MTAIKQLQMSYNAEEDRILLRLNTTSVDEFRFWITRRFSELLIQALRAHRLADPDIVSQPSRDARQAVQEFKEEAAIAGGNFKEAFEETNSFPLGEQPVLAFRLTYKVDAGKLALTIEPRQGKGVNIVLDSQLNFNVTKLLKSASDAGNWKLAWDDAGAGDLSAGVVENRIIN